MARALSVFCCLIVGLQLLVGVPLLVCVGFFAVQGGIGPIAIEVHAGPVHAPQMLIHGPTVPPPTIHAPQPLAMAPPPNVIPPQASINHDNAILEARDQHGSLLTGTVMSAEASCGSERDLFVAALEKVASQASHESHEQQTAASAQEQAAACPDASECCQQSAAGSHNGDELVVRRLYELAEVEERAGKFDRADQWRALAREIRQSSGEAAADQRR